MPDFLAEIEKASRGRAMYDHLVIECVQKARDHGVPWDAIGESLGVSRQAATERYKKHMRDPDGA